MIKVNLYATFRVNRGKTISVPFQKDMTVEEIINNLKIAANDIAIIICDGVDGTPEKMLKFQPEDGQTIHLFPPVAGG